jgi:hypothetical protein
MAGNQLESEKFECCCKTLASSCDFGFSAGMGSLSSSSSATKIKRNAATARALSVFRINQSEVRIHSTCNTLGPTTPPNGAFKNDKFTEGVCFSMLSY